jgi:hypothetical protein
MLDSTYDVPTSGGGGGYFHGAPAMSDSEASSDKAQNKLVEEIVELQRLFYFENKNKDTERQRKLREIIDRATPLKGS